MSKSSLCVQQIKFACENLGFFYLKNHGFNEKDVEETFHRIKLYFDQSHEEKINYKINEHYYGYIDLQLFITPTVINNDQEDIRAGSHSDYGSLTVLFQKDIGGLEILPHNSTEFPSFQIVCIQNPQRVVIYHGQCNLGWLLVIWTDIVSLIFFHAGSDDVLDRIPSKLIPQNDDNTKYITAGEHLQNKLNAAYQKFY
ncbi:Clavaminate synthase-like protein [Gigaspora margarita]|uniref:Clavaminate synthase-like protein n=1 Tax=Gigaspora margarita TaxID=4874 RepID=A0A8H4A4B9_GIGMA|nr:Clavaminate synthase-like protein [Gigaspora margarita]